MDLKFDKMTVDITLAQNYLRSEKKVINLKYNPSDSLSAQNNNYQKLLEVADKFKENTSLLAQLEYVKRKVAVEDTLIQINLIVQYIHYLARQVQSQVNTNKFLTSKILMKITNNVPLFIIGAIPKEILLNNFVCIQADDTTEAICYLITKLYQDAGFPVAATLEPDDLPVVEIKLPLGAIGVISEYSDVDSAVDVFLASSLQVPWRLQRILVQESAYQQFKNALKWKCNLNKQKTNANNTTPDVWEYNDRMFLMDMASFSESQLSPVIIEAYRTRKELKSILSSYQPHYLSLWANDIAEINEIAYSVGSPVVWINNFGDFRGPPKLSEAVCSYIKISNTTQTNMNEIFELQKSWQALDFEARRNVLCKMFDDFDVGKDHPYKKIQNDLLITECGANDTFVDVGNDYVCIGLPLVSNVKICFVNKDDIFTTPFFEAILKGNAFVAVQIPNEATHIFQKFRIPVVYSADWSHNYLRLWHPMPPFNDTQNLKVIWTNSGTIFAN